MPLEQLEPLLRLGVALALGLLIGIERGWHGRELAEGQRVAGVRSFGIIGLLGGVAALLTVPFGGLIVPAAFLALGAIVTIAHWHHVAEHRDFGTTTVLAALVTFALGALAGVGRLEVAAAGAVVMTLLLGIKPELHRLLRRIERHELRATIRLLLISVVLLPVLPDRTYDPWQAINPYRIWWMVVLIAAISYAGYFAVRIAGERRGVLATGLMGGLASSTAVTLSLARLARHAPEKRSLLAAGIVAAAATMFPRILVIAAVVAPPLARQMAAPLLAASLVGFAAAALYAGGEPRARAGMGGDRTGPANPLELRMAVQFGLLLALVMLLARILSARAGDAGLYALAAASGLADVDAINLSLASMVAQGAVGVPPAAAGVLLAAAANTAVKPVLVAAVGEAGLAWRIALPLAAALAAGGLTAWLTGAPA